MKSSFIPENVVDSEQAINSSYFNSEHLAKLCIILDKISEIIMILDPEGIVKYESNSIESLFGYELAEIIDTNFLSRAHPDDHPMLTDNLRECVSQKDSRKTMRYRIRHKDGNWRHVDLVIHNMLEVPLINGILAILKDQTEFERVKWQASYFKNYDFLTGLPNKELFIERINNEIDRSVRVKNDFAVMAIDLKKIKNINDIYGLAFGNEVIKIIGSKLKSAFRDNDFVARFDGANFYVFLASLDHPQSAGTVFEKTKRIFDPLITIRDHSIKVNAGMGICFYPEDAKDCDSLIQSSEAAIRKGQNHQQTTYSLFSKNKNREMLKKIKIEEEMQSASFRNELFLNYQPKVDSNGDILGLEALLRWNSAQRGFISPEEFIPIAENSGLILSMGLNVLYEACYQCRKIQEMNISPIPIAVNFSPYEFNRTDIVGNIQAAIKETELDPKLLELEITERGIMENEEEAIEKLQAIHDMNVSISIDDFGTGYSSLSKLRNYPIDKIKIDKSFIGGLPTDEKSDILVKSMISLAHNMGYTIIAEGVETEEQLSYLKANGCNEYQGFYFYRPMDGDNLESLLKKTS